MLVLVVAVAVAAPLSPATAPTPPGAVVLTQDEEEEDEEEEEEEEEEDDEAAPSFFEQHFALSVDDDLEEETDRYVLMFFLGQVLPFGAIWLPPILIGGGFPGDYLKDAILSWVMHILVQALFVPLVFCPPLFIVVVLFNGYYWLPVAIVNAYDRNLKAAKRDGTWKGSKDGAVRYDVDDDAVSMAY